MLMMVFVCIRFFSLQNPHWIWLIQMISLPTETEKIIWKVIRPVNIKEKINGKFPLTI